MRLSLGPSRRTALQGFADIRFIRGQNLFPDSASSASQRLCGRNWFIGLKRELGLAAEYAWRAVVREDLADAGGEVLDEFGDHFARHPKTAGRTNTGGAVFF